MLLARDDRAVELEEAVIEIVEDPSRGGTQAQLVSATTTGRGRPGVDGEEVVGGHIVASAHEDAFDDAGGGGGDDCLHLHRREHL